MLVCCCCCCCCCCCGLDFDFSSSFESWIWFYMTQHLRILAKQSCFENDCVVCLFVPAVKSESGISLWNGCCDSDDVVFLWMKRVVNESESVVMKVKALLKKVEVLLMKAKLLLWKYCYKSKSASNRWGERNLVAFVAFSLLGGLPLPEQRLQPKLGLIFSSPTLSPLIFLELGSPSSIPIGAGLSLKSLRMLARWPDDDEVAVAVPVSPGHKSGLGPSSIMLIAHMFTSSIFITCWSWGRVAEFRSLARMSRHYLEVAK